MKYSLKKSIVLCLATMILCVATGCYKTEYSATASILVTNGAVTTSYAETTDKISGSDISASLYLANTVVDILNTPDIYIELANELGEEDYQSLQNSFLIARRSEDTLFVDITYSNSDQKKAVDIVNKFTELACDYIPRFIPSARVNVASIAVKAQKQGLF